LTVAVNNLAQQAKTNFAAILYCVNWFYELNTDLNIVQKPVKFSAEILHK